MKHLPLLPLLLILVPGSADAGNGFTFPIGGRAAGMSGAYTAMAEEASIAWYNPAGLGFNDRSSLDVSGSAYFLEMVRIPEFVRTNVGGAEHAADFGANPFQVVASSLSYVYAVGRRGPRPPGPAGDDAVAPPDVAEPARVPDDAIRHSLALSVFIPAAAKYSQSDRFDLQFENASFHQRFSLSNEASIYYLGPSWGMRIGDRWAIGASLFVTYATQSLRAVYDVDFDFHTDVEGVAAGHHYVARHLDTSLTAIGAALVLGAQVRPVDRLRIGVTLRLPPFRIWRSTSGSFLETASDGPDGRPAFADESLDDTAWLAWSGPFSVSLGLAWADPGKWAISVDGDYTAPMSAGDADNRGYFNGRLGVEAWLGERFVLGFGGFTDVTPVRPLPDPPPGDWFGATRMDFYGGTVAVTYLSPYLVTGSDRTDRITFSTTLGFKYAYGFGDVVGYDLDFDASAEGFAPKRITAHDLSVMVGSSVVF